MIYFLTFLSLVGLQDSWTMLTSPGGRFKVTCPGPMTEHIITAQPEIGEIKYHTFSYQRLDSLGKATIFMVSYYDYPLGKSFQDSIDLKQELYTATIDEAAQSIQGDLVYAQDDFSYSNFGKIWRINFRDGEAFSKTKAFFQENRYYSIQIVGSVGAISAVEERKFFNSLKIL